MKNLTYPYTNENLRSIVAGMEPNPQDRILAVGGSGDQAFALLEYGPEIEVVDNSQAQIEYIRFRKEALERGEIDWFLKPEGWKRPEIVTADNRDDLLFNKLGISRISFNQDLGFERQHIEDYFFDEVYRISRIKGNLSRLLIHDPQDLAQIEDFGKYTKLYLSNCLTYKEIDFSRKLIAKKLRRFAKTLREGGLIYTSDYRDTFGIRSNGLDGRLDWKNADLDCSVLEGLEIDIDLSLKAREFGGRFGQPTVFRKVKTN